MSKGKELKATIKEQEVKIGGDTYLIKTESEQTVKFKEGGKENEEAENEMDVRYVKKENKDKKEE